MAASGPNVRDRYRPDTFDKLFDQYRVVSASSLKHLGSYHSGTFDGIQEGSHHLDLASWVNFSRDFGLYPTLFKLSTLKTVYGAANRDKSTEAWLNKEQFRWAMKAVVEAAVKLGQEDHVQELLRILAHEQKQPQTRAALISEIRRLCNRAAVDASNLAAMLSKLPEEERVARILPCPLQQVVPKLTSLVRQSEEQFGLDVQEIMLMIASHLEISLHLSKIHRDGDSDAADVIANTLMESIKVWAVLILLKSLPYGREAELMVGSESSLGIGEGKNLSYAVQMVQVAVNQASGCLVAGEEATPLVIPATEKLEVVLDICHQKVNDLDDIRSQGEVTKFMDHVQQGLEALRLVLLVIAKMKELHIVAEREENEGRRQHALARRAIVLWKEWQVIRGYRSWRHHHQRLQREHFLAHRAIRFWADVRIHRVMLAWRWNAEELRDQQALVYVGISRWKHLLLGKAFRQLQLQIREESKSGTQLVSRASTRGEMKPGRASLEDDDRNGTAAAGGTKTKLSHNAGLEHGTGPKSHNQPGQRPLPQPETRKLPQVGKHSRHGGVSHNRRETHDDADQVWSSEPQRESHDDADQVWSSEPQRRRGERMTAQVYGPESSANDAGYERRGRHQTREGGREPHRRGGRGGDYDEDEDREYGERGGGGRQPHRRERRGGDRDEDRECDSYNRGSESYSYAAEDPHRKQVRRSEAQTRLESQRNVSSPPQLSQVTTRDRKAEPRPAWSSGWGSRLGDQPPRCERDHLISQAIASSRRNSVSSQVTVESDATDFARLRGDLESINFPGANGNGLEHESTKGGTKPPSLTKRPVKSSSKRNAGELSDAEPPDGYFCDVVMTLPMSGRLAGRNSKSPFRSPRRKATPIEGNSGDEAVKGALEVVEAQCQAKTKQSKPFPKYTEDVGSGDDRQTPRQLRSSNRLKSS